MAISLGAPSPADAAVWPLGPVSLVVPSLEVGGAERNLVALAGALHRHGTDVEIIALDGRGPLRDRLPAGLTLVDFGAARARQGVGALVRHLRVRRPSVVLATVEHASVLALLAGRMAGVPVIVRVATSLTVTPERGTPLTSRLARRTYRRADALVANSQGSAADLADYLRLPRERVAVLPNLTVDEQALRVPREPPDVWLDGDRRVPVIVAVARLDPIKGLDVLLEAVARLLTQRAVRLLVVGEGPLRGALEDRIAALGLAPAVRLVGHHDDPVAFLQHADLFCLASTVEGMPNAMIEAMACGLGVVATDCPHGPAELLQQGRWGRLVSAGDPVALADALARSLDDPRVAPEAAWRVHTVEAGAAAYARLLAEVEAG